ncbi:MAG: hypothetical protein ACE5IH_08395, partial [Thermodesulfobacteriota bacterium]
NYSFNTSGSNPMLLTSSGTPVVMSGTVSSGNYQWGVMSGPLFTQNDLSSLACDFNSNNTCGWQAWSDLDVFYTWETGHNEWNQYAGLKDNSDQFVSFEPPLHITYTHSTANDANSDSTYNGRIYQLEYSGFGELHGIPFVDSDGDDRWYPEFNIKDGTTMGNSNEYTVKAIEKESFMQSIGDANCSGANLDTTAGLSAPSNDYVDPAIGTQPTVTDPPAVIKGELQ